MEYQIKYKTKYYLLKDKLGIKDDIINALNKSLNDNYTNTINSMEIIHDIKNNIDDLHIMDFINQIDISYNEFENVEDFVKIKIAKESYENNKLFDSDVIKNMIIVFDNATENYEIIQKLYYLFGITKYYKTFIGESEKLLTSSEDKIDKTSFYDISKNRIKDEYINEALSIGISLKMDKIFSYKPFLDNSDPDKICKELKKIYEIYNEYIETFKNDYKNTNYQEIFEYIFDGPAIDQIKKILFDINNNPNSNDIIYNKYIKKVNMNTTGIKNLIYSVKEARDGYYLEEIKKMKENNILFITNDLILSLRAFYDNISCIHTYQSKIQYIGIYQNDDLFFMNNPFELLIKGNYKDNENYRNLNKIDIKKDLINNILSNPIAILKLSKNKAINSKYLNIKFDNDELPILCELYRELNRKERKIFMSYDDEINKEKKINRIKKERELLKLKIKDRAQKYVFIKKNYRDDCDLYKIRHLLNFDNYSIFPNYYNIIQSQINKIAVNTDLYDDLQKMFFN